MATYQYTIPDGADFFAVSVHGPNPGLYTVCAWNADHAIEIVKASGVKTANSVFFTLSINLEIARMPQNNQNRCQFGFVGVWYSTQ
jgi:hypothetical protein